MARTINDIYLSIISEKNLQTNLSALVPSVDNLPLLITDMGNSPSRVAVWRLWAFLMAVACWSEEVLWDRFKAGVDSDLANKEPATTTLWRTQMLAFQYGIGLTLVGNVYRYATFDPTTQVITQAAVVEAAGRVYIKVATGTGTLSPISNNQVDAANEYVKRIKPAGLIVQVVSYPADLLSVGYTVFYDPLFDITTLQSNVETAINSFVAGLPFNGVLNLNKLTDAIQAVAGVTDPRIGTVQARVSGGTFAPIVGEYQSLAGYCAIDSATPLSTTITYTPYV